MLALSKLVWGVQLVGLVSAFPSNGKVEKSLLPPRAITCSLKITTAVSDTCETVISRFGITKTNLSNWNPTLGPNCSGFVGGQTYCVRGSGTPDPVTSTSVIVSSSTSTTSTFIPASTISKDGSCGGTAGLTCTGATFGKCCSSGNWCGNTAAHCQAGCQDKFGVCDSNAGTISTDGTCGGAEGKTCTGSTFGDCCSSNGYCGTTDGHCKAGCQTAFSSSCQASNISTDGTCGTNGKTCTGSSFGECCSSSGYCGTTSDHCKVGCQIAFSNKCEDNNISIDGSCGTNGKTCTGSSFGECCSSSNYCGSTADHCKVGCQTLFSSKCETNNISIDGQCGGNGKTCTGSSFGTCCSAGGWCGSTASHCDVDAKCQPAFGTCSSSNLSTDGKCGANGKTCVGTSYGNCCSSSGYCGTGVDFCAQGCQKGSSSACITSNIPSLTGECGKNGGFVCAGGPYDGKCCSTNGYCGSGAGFPC